MISKKRKIFNIVMLSLAAVLILGVLVCGSWIGISFLKTKDMRVKSEAQIAADAAVFDADMSYLLKYNIFGNTMRFGYNKNTTVKIVLSSKLQEQTKRTAEDVVNNKLNPIMRRINDKYQFEVVEEKDFKRTKNDKAVIYLKSKIDSRFFSPDGLTYFEWISSGINPVQTYNRIVINEYGFNEDDPSTRLNYTITHELLHVLGFDDVYDVGNYGTFMKVDGSMSEYPLLKPNDLRVLAALYFDDYGNTESLKSWIAEYTDNYYAGFGKLFSDITELPNYEMLSFGGNFMYTQEAEPTQLTSIDSPLTGTFSGISQSGAFKFNFVFENGFFNYSLTDLSTQTVIEEKQGKCHIVDGKMFLGALNIRVDGELYKTEVAVCNSDEGYILIGIDTSFGYLQDIFITVDKIILEAN